MSIKDLFNKKSITFDSIASASVDAESSANISASSEENQTFLPVIDFSTASNFVKYGSAELYYENSIKRIYQQYPYDGSLAEKTQFQLSSSALDRWMYNYKYPKTTGYALLGENFGSSLGSAVGNSTQAEPNYEGYGNLEYIKIAGGIHTASAGMIGTPLTDTFDDSVVYHTASNRTTSLRTNLVSGSTIEFWLRKPQVISSTGNEVIFDLWNGEASSSAEYGRMTVEYRTVAGSSKRFTVTLYSGSAGFTRKEIGVATSSPLQADWAHYAISFQSESSGVRTRLYTNGEETSNDLLGSAGVDEIGKKINAHIGSLIANPHGNPYHDSSNTAYLGYGRLTGSIDEFRFWKTRRTSEEIKKNYWHPMGGGQNKKHPDEQMRDLGIYFKFNEGITTVAATDATVLDYSGRIANGDWTGYHANSRNTGSAMVSASVLTTEPPDPIIYSTHPDVTALTTEMQTSGSLHDRVSGSFLYETVPSWIREEDVNGNTKAIFQIMSSYFDTLYSQISELNKLQDKKYFNVDNPTYEVRPTEFAKRMLEGRGLMVPELFPNASVMEYFMQRDANNLKFDENLNDIKNLIYQNIYNNLEHIFKSKGTHESYRNLLRCFGIDDEILKLNMYTDKGTHYLRDNVRHTSVKKKYINFNSTDKFDATVYQTASTSGGKTFISGSKTDYYEQYSAFTYEIDMIAPHKIKPGQSGHFLTPFTTASVFGQHTAIDDQADYTWHGTDSSEFRVYLIRDELNSDNAYFMLTSSVLAVKLTSSVYYKIYDNERWNLAVRMKPNHFPIDGGVDTSSAPTYQIEFYGVNHTTDNVRNEFDLSASVSNALGKSFMSSHKRVYMGAHRTNFTGAVVDQTDIQAGSARVWMDYLDNATIKQHSLDPFNYGAAKAANSNSTMFTVELSGTHIPRYDSLALHWQLDTLTSSTAAGLLEIDDFSSGSSGDIYGWVDNIINEKHPARGQFFPNSSITPISNEFVFASRKQLPEVSVSYDRIFIKGDEEKYFIEDDDVSDNFYSLEKSFYGNVSEEIMDTFSTVAELSNLMGKYQDRYKRNYSRMDHFKRLFFERVDGDLDFDQFTSYFKWIDSSISMIVRQLVPLSARISPEVSNMVEDHILERNKYDNKFPLLERESQDPKFGRIKAINELSYNWKFGHAPIETLVSEEPSSIFIENVSNTSNFAEYLLTPSVSLGIGTDPKVFTPTDFTISMWLNPSSTATTTSRKVFGLSPISLRSPVHISIDSSNKLSFGTVYSGEMITWTVDDASKLPEDEWTHVVVVFNGSASNSAQSDSSAIFYINGSAYSGTVNRTSSSGAFPTGNPDAYDYTGQTFYGWVLGLGQDGSLSSFTGKVDDLAIWKTLLSSSEVTTSYNSGGPYDLKTIQASHVVAWWRMGDSPFDTEPPQLSVHNEVNPNHPLQQIGTAGDISFQTGGSNVYSSTSLATSDPTFSKKHSLWWDERALRDYDVTTGVSAIDTQREKIRKLSTFEASSSSPNFAKTDNTIYDGSAYALRRFSKPYKMLISEQQVLHAGTNYDRRKNRDIIHSSVHIHGGFSNLNVPHNVVLIGAEDKEGLVPEVASVDITNPDLDSLGTSIIAKKKKRDSNALIGREFDDADNKYEQNLPGDMVLPFNIYSASTKHPNGATRAGAYETIALNYAEDTIFTNLHSDTYGNQNDIGLQGPFSDTWVGGHQHRHVELNRKDTSLVSFLVNPNNPNQTISQDPSNNLTDIHSRPEAWYIYHQSAGRLDDPLGYGVDPDGIIGVVGPDYGFGYPSSIMLYAARYRDERAKRPVNIRNIKTIRPQFDSDGDYVTSSTGVHRQSHPYFHSGSNTTQIMTGSQKLGNFYSNYEVVQTSGRSANNLYLRKAFTSADIDKQESPFIPEAMRSTTSEIYSGSAILPDATHYSALYGRRPTSIHNDGNIFLREPKYVGEGSSDDVNYCVDFVNTPDSGLSVRRMFTNMPSIIGTNRLRNFCLSMWFNLSGTPNLGSNEYAILAQIGQHPGNINYSYELHLVRVKSGPYAFRVVIGGTTQMGVYITDTSSSALEIDDWTHVVVEFVSSKLSGSDIPVRVLVAGQELALTTVSEVNGWNPPETGTTRFCLSENTTRKLNMSSYSFSTFARFKGYLSDCFLISHANNSTGLSETLLKRFYNRGFLCDPTLLTDREILFWFAMGRNDADVLESTLAGFESSPTTTATYDGTALENEGGIKIYNLINKTGNHSDMVLDEQQENATTTQNSFATPSQVPTGKPIVADTSGYHWEYAFDKNPSLSGSNSDSVFVNRFSSPGGPEVMSRGFLDAAAGEYSVYNALPWRNLSVKGTKPRSTDPSIGTAVGPFNGAPSQTYQAGIHVVDQHNEFDGLFARLARHSGRYGTDPKKVTDSQILATNISPTTYEERINMPSWHKQQRNIARVVTTTSTLSNPKFRDIFDNAYVSTPIPRSDFQYSWVTASLAQDYSVHSGQQQIYGYAPRSGEIKASTEVTVNSTGHYIQNHEYNTGYYIGQVNLNSFYTETWTFSAWIYPDLQTLGVGEKSYLYTVYLNDQGGTSYYNEIYLERLSNNKGRLWLKVPNRDGDYGEWYYDLDSSSHHEWTHISIAFDGTDPSCPSMFYINGVEVIDIAQAAFTGTPMTTRSTDQVYVYDYDGQNNTSSDKNFIGGFDETVFHNKVLKQADITKIYNSGKSYDHLSRTAPSGLVAWWRFGDERDFQGDTYSQQDSTTDGGRIIDRTGNGYSLEVENYYGQMYTTTAIGITSFDEKKIQYRTIIEAITFPSASEIIGV